MKSQITKRQIIILFILIWVLIAAVVLMYVILPMTDNYNTSEETLADSEMRYNELLLAEPTIAGLNKDIDELTQQINTLMEPFCERMESEQADIMLRKVFTSYGLRADILAITEPEAIEDTEYKYEVPKLANDGETANGDVPQSATDIINFDSTTSDTTNDTAANVKATPNSGIYVMRANYAIYGEYKNILKAIKQLNELESVTIQTLDFSAEKIVEEETAFSIIPNGDATHTTVEKVEELTTQTEYNFAIIIFMK